MCSSQCNMESNGIIIENYKDVETNKAYDLLIYQCSINNIDRSFVVGSVTNKIIDIDKINEFINKIINFRFNNTWILFILGTIYIAKKNKVFDSLNLSNEAYNLLIKCRSHECFKEKFIFGAKETVLDKTTRRFSTIHTTPEPFNHISYYIELEEQKNNSEKSLKKAI